MKMWTNNKASLLLASALIVNSGLLTGSVQANDTSEVTQATKEARLSWKPPTSHTDGSALLGLDHFNIYMRAPDQPWKRIDTIDAKQTSYTVRNLPVGKHEFAVTAVCPKHGESALSNVVSKEIGRSAADRTRG